ncbi:hypothetical protein ACFQDG_19700, partial [Natronoarchaeum mannanilyticum]|uniref:hypothetical protein n=1 Tax=Natronoarchaeum mannanilyticum TaxID=926360 RepID=UPI00361DE4C3
MSQLYLASTIATGAALLVVAYLFARTNERHRAAAVGSFESRRPQSTGGTTDSQLSRLARTPLAWYLGFAAAPLGVVGAGIA